MAHTEGTEGERGTKGTRASDSVQNHRSPFAVSMRVRAYEEIARGELPPSNWTGWKKAQSLRPRRYTDPMDATSWTIIGTGIAIIIANAGMFAWLRGDLAKLAGRVDSLSERVDSLSERMARMEGKTDLLLQGLQIRIEPRPTAK